LQKSKWSTFAKVERGGPLNGTFLSSILILTFAKNGKSPDLFWKSPEKFCKSQSQNRKIGVRIPSNTAFFYLGSEFFFSAVFLKTEELGYFSRTFKVHKKKYVRNSVNTHVD